MREGRTAEVRDRKYALCPHPSRDARLLRCSRSTMGPGRVQTQQSGWRTRPGQAPGDSSDSSESDNWDGRRGIGCEVGLAILHPCRGCTVTQDQRSELARDGTPAVSAHQKTHIRLAAIRKQRSSTMGQIQEGRLAAGEKSIRKARPRTYCCQPCRQSRSRRVLFTVANLI